MAFRKGDKVTITNPIQPTGHKGGETATVIDSGTVAGTKIVQIQDDQTGSLTGVYPQEITRR
ncbi:hypothetical protein ACIA6D_23445 [Streptomyces cacaoi]